MSYIAGAKGTIASRAYPRQGLCECLKLEIRAGTYKKQDSNSSRLVLGMDSQIRRHRYSLSYVQNMDALGYK